MLQSKIEGSHTFIKFLNSFKNVPLDFRLPPLFLAGELGYLRQNLSAAMAGKEVTAKYDGYTSCPLILSPKECILAEFDFQAPPQPLETMPYNQAKPSRLNAMMKRFIMPELYWKMMLK